MNFTSNPLALRAVPPTTTCLFPRPNHQPEAVPLMNVRAFVQKRAVCIYPKPLTAIHESAKDG